MKKICLIVLFILEILLITGCETNGNLPPVNTLIAGTLSIQLNPSSILINDTTTVTVALNNSSGITSPVSVSIESDNKVTILPYVCQLTSAKPTCTATIQASSVGLSVVKAKAVSYPTVSATLNILLNPEPGNLSLSLSPALALFKEHVTATVKLTNSVGIKSPITVFINGGSNATVNPGYSCQLTTTNPTCKVMIIAGQTIGDSTITATSSGYNTKSSLLNITNFKILSLLDTGVIQVPIYSGLLKAGDNNFYGTTFAGGDYGLGSIYKVTPSGDFTTVYSFNSNSAWPSSTLIQDTNGNFYGTTCAGGQYGDGSLFEYSKTGELITLASFNVNATPPLNTGCPQGTLVNYKGSIYGVTIYNNTGAIFRFSFSNGALSILYTFTGGLDGGYPESGLTLDPSNGYLYGTTIDGGYYANGTIYKIDSEGKNFTSLFSFRDNKADAKGTLILANGSFYGTTFSGGNVVGTIFSFLGDSNTPTVTSTQFNGNNGAWPYAGLFQNKHGDFYGTTSGGGANFYGSIFQFTPSNIPNTPGQITSLYSFDGISSCNPRTSLIEDDSDNLYGISYGCTDVSPNIFGFSPS